MLRILFFVLALQQVLSFVIMNTNKHHPVKIDAASGCNSSSLIAPGTAQSINYPQNYPNSAYCMYKLNAQSGQKIQVTFTAVDTEACCDILWVYDGADEKSPLLGRLSGFYNTSPTYTSTASQMTIVFDTDLTVSFTGFQAKFKAI